MKFINTWYILVWIVLLLISIIYAPVTCYDDFVIDETILKQNCGVTREEYIQQINLNESFCPEGEKAYRMTGGCKPNLISIIYVITLMSIIYNIIYTLIYFILRRKKNTTQ